MLHVNKDNFGQLMIFIENKLIFFRIIEEKSCNDVPTLILDRFSGRTEKCVCKENAGRRR
jgi:hypothetical protein